MVFLLQSRMIHESAAGSHQRRLTCNFEESCDFTQGNYDECPQRRAPYLYAGIGVEELVLPKLSLDTAFPAASRATAVRV